MQILQLRAIASPTTNRNAKKPGNKCNLVVRFFLISLLSFTLTTTWIPAAFGQISLFSVPQQNGGEQLIWDINSPKPCGNLVCSTVYLDGSPLFTLAAQPTAETDRNSALSIDERSKNVQRILQQIINQKTNSQVIARLFEPSLIFDEQQQQLQLSPQEEVDSSEPLRVEVGVKNNQTVIFLPEQPGLQQQTILTINEYDALHNGKPIDELAQQWRDIIRNALDRSIQERRLQAENPLAKPLIIAAIALGATLVILLLGWVGIRLRKFDGKLREQLIELRQTLAVDPESVTSATEEKSDSELPSKQNSGVATANKSKTAVSRKGNGTKARHSHPWTVVADAQQAVSEGLQSFLHNLPRVSLEQHRVLKQQRNFTQLLLRVMFLVQIVIVILAAGALAAVYPNTRIYSRILLDRAFGLPLLWIGISLVDKISDLLIDYYLNRWAEDAQISSPNSQRYTLRVSTYSPALKGLTTLIFVGFGIIFTANLLGVNTAVLASFGAVAAIVTYLSRNLIEDMINGALILYTDRYAVGDVIKVGDVTGFVENMNLYITQLRGDEGRLITIPNGSVKTVENLTKDWSRVDFKIEIAYDADVKKALEVIRKVAEQMQSEPEWQEKILEPASILGVDKVSYSGILIQVWIKTLPIQQWAVGREFRLRVKQAFDEAGISIGVPQQEVWYHSQTASVNSNSNKVIARSALNREQGTGNRK